MLSVHARLGQVLLCLTLAGTLAAPASAPAAPRPASSDDDAGWGYQSLDADTTGLVRDALAAMKIRERGPYARLRWFCADGTVLPPQPFACREHGGGRQHGEYTAAAARLHELGFHVGPVLAAIDWEAFYDLDNSHYYLRELVLQRFLENSDDGWVMRRARFYRGARQAENEEATGRRFLERLLANGAWVERNYLLASSVVAAVPHGTPGVAGEAVRGLALRISEADPAFMNLRVKIHSSPGAGDLAAVSAYREQLAEHAPPQVRQWAEELEADLQQVYSAGLDRAGWERLAVAVGGEIGGRLRSAPTILDEATPEVRAGWLAQLVASARAEVEAASARGDGEAGLALFDALHFARARMFIEANTWADELLVGDTSRRQLLDSVGVLATAAYGSGWLTGRESQAIEQRLEETAADTLTRAQYQSLARYLGRAVEWGAAAADQMVAIAAQRYGPVEVAAAGFTDDAVRGSLLLPLAEVLNRLEGDAAAEAGLRYQLGEAQVSSGVMGLNPGAAVGILHVITDQAQVRDLDPTGIYVLPETPADLGRIAGILTIDQGSRLSHVQLLARGLGVPNATVSSRHLATLRGLAGSEVLYAVSPLGSVLVAPRSAVSAATLEQFHEHSIAHAPRVTIDTAALDLDTRRVLPLEAIQASDSGRVAGPKAANLGQLHQLFPTRVAPGLVIPFGVFRAHVDRDLDGDGRTLYEEAAEIYARGGERRQVSRDLARIADRIRAMPLIPAFERELLALLRARFELEGARGVFVRSDTNVEDLHGFSGAGLNLTVMNVGGEQEILQAVRDVWASPYRERSYEWRQQVVTNPEAVYPSVLILGSVPAEVSGVLVTRDIDRTLMGNEDLGPAEGWTVTVAAGVGAAVEGEATETVVLPAREGAFEPVLLSSARAAWRNALGADGDIQEMPSFGDVTLLTPARLADLRKVIDEIHERYPDDAESRTPWDIEFGFLGDDTVLFQIRPFVLGGDTALDELRAMDERVLAGSSEPVALGGVVR